MTHSTNILVHCGCGKRYPVNLWKHPGRDHTHCPFCGRMHKNDFNPKWTPNAEWHKNKHQSRPFTLADMRKTIENRTSPILRRLNLL